VDPDVVDRNEIIVVLAILFSFLIVLVGCSL